MATFHVVTLRNGHHIVENSEKYYATKIGTTEKGENETNIFIKMLRRIQFLNRKTYANHQKMQTFFM